MLKILRDVFDFFVPLPHWKLEWKDGHLFLMTSPKLRLEAQAIAFIEHGKPLVIRRRFYTFRALVAHFWGEYCGAREMRELIALDSLHLRRGAIAFDSTGQSSATTTNFTFAFTTSGSNRAIGAGPARRPRGGSSPIASITYNSVSLAVVSSTFAENTNADISTECFFLANPASGSNTLSVSGGGSTWTSCGVNSFSGAYQSGTDGANNAQANSGDASTTVTTSFNNTFVMDTAARGGDTAPTVGAGQTQRWNVSPAAFRRHMGSTEQKVSAGGCVMNWTGGSGEYVIGAFGIREATASFVPRVMIF